ncbi:hypothetical protein FHX08_002040 [Rhizobium sp. BK529]|uniref:hypothetical protein n=1 Tax=Rhizobium sp. BK529 TaxID=2586983 RepID=UPI001622E7A5|nr:hypothetical protein [Rhizobium sp. BK529]MBB3591696.1 hypothetical protein [Rhizobium sp. BK529]
MTTSKVIATAELYLSRQPVHERDAKGEPLYTAGQMLRAFCAGEIAIIEESESVGDDVDQCPICAEPLKRSDICATDIEMGICHAACLEGSPVVDLETGDEVEGGAADRFRYGDSSDIPLEAYRDELLKIAEDVGEGTDPFAAWEAIQALKSAATPPPVPQMLGTALLDVAAERRRQVEVEGWTPAHDDRHTDGSMAQAAAAYALKARSDESHANGVRIRPPYLWPDSWHVSWWKPKDRRRDLVRAAALIIAEIERLDRAAVVAPIPEKSDARALLSGPSTRANSEIEPDE